MRPTASFCIAGLFVVIALALASCGHRREQTVGALNGRVVDAAGRPLAGAHVFVIWVGEVDVLVDSQMARIRVCKTRSRADGTFHVDAWQAPSIAMGRITARSVAYVAGFNSRPPHRAADHLDDGEVVHELRAAEPGDPASWEEVSDAGVVDCSGRITTTAESDRPWPATD